MLNELYQEIILDHYKYPRNRGGIENATITAHDNNPLCGDEITVYARLDGDRIVQLGFLAQGCSISQASASMLTEKLRGLEVDKAQGWVQTVKDLMHGSETVSEEELEDLEALKGVRKFPVRVKCALLAWSTLEKGIEEWRRNGPKHPPGAQGPGASTVKDSQGCH